MSNKPKNHRLASCCKNCRHSEKIYMTNNILFNKVCSLSNSITTDVAVCDDFKIKEPS